MIDHRNIKLGALAPHPPEHSKRLMLTDFLAPDLPAPKKSVDWTHGVSKRPSFGNNIVGDCTCAAIANIVMGLLKVVYGSGWVPTTSEVFALYSAISGWSPNDPSTDTGCVIEDVVAYVIKHGFVGHHFITSGAVAPTDTDNIKRSIELFGNVDWGAALPIVWQGAGRWPLPPNRSGNNAPGSWGRHSIASEKYDEQY